VKDELYLFAHIVLNTLYDHMMTEFVNV